MKVLRKKNYLSMIENTVGTTMFQNLWVQDNEKILDATKGGTLSCAVFVSSILKLFDLLSEQKATVDNLIKVMLENGWTEIKVNDIQAGDVLVWNKKKDQNGEQHGHIGFYIGNQKAISNSTKLKKIVRHGFDYGGRRKIVKVLRWEKW